MPLGSLAELRDFTHENASEFLQRVHDNGLFVYPGGTGKESIRDAIAGYRQYCAEWRSDPFNKLISKVDDPALVVGAIMERLAPQFHALENTQELQADPLFINEASWHYHKLCSSTHEKELSSHHEIDLEHTQTARAITQPRFKWLGNIPLQTVAELRTTNENEAFRDHLRKYTAQLRGANLEDVDRVCAEVGRGIVSLIAEHQKDIDSILTQYKLKHGQTVVMSWVTLAAQYFPSVAPYVQATSLAALVAKYGWDKVAEASDKRAACRTLAGVLAASHSSDRPS